MTLSRWATPRNLQTSSAFSSHSKTFWVESPLNSGIRRSSIALSTIVWYCRNGLLWKRKYDKQQRCLPPRFNLHSSHKYIYSLRSQQSVSLCHNKSLSSSHYPWQHANFTVPWNHRPINNVKCQVHKFISSVEMLCLLV